MLVSATMVLLLDAVWTLAATAAMVVVLLLLMQMLLEMVMAMMKSRRRGIEEEGEGETFGDVGGGCGSDDGLR